MNDQMNTNFQTQSGKKMIKYLWMEIIASHYESFEIQNCFAWYQADISRAKYGIAALSWLIYTLQELNLKCLT